MIRRRTRVVGSLAGKRASLMAVFLFLLILFLLPGLVWGLASDREQPIHIQADSLEMDEAKGVSQYRGDVRFVQGSIVLSADFVIVYSEDKRVRKVIATGSPAHFSQQLDGEDGEMRARASRIEYFASKELLQLHGDAYLWQADNQFTGDLIEYGLKDEVVMARKAKSGDERVRIVIQPDKKTHQSAQKNQAQSE